MNVTEFAIAVAVIGFAYLIGGIPWGVVMAKLTGGTDPRTVGSGRTGGANVMRALGPRVAVASGLLDVAKGVVAVGVAVVAGAGLPVQVLAALAAILGHSRSVFIGFAGGRGIAPGFGGLIVLQPIAALVVMPVFVLVLLVSRYSSLASLTATAIGAVVVVITVLVAALSPIYAIYAVAAAVMIWLFHLDNIQRLLAGSERRIEFRRQ